MSNDTISQLHSVLAEIKSLIERSSYQSNRLLTTEEAAKFLNISKSALYKLTSQRQIPFSSPTGKRNYFKQNDLAEFLEKNKIKPIKTDFNN